MTSKGMKVVGRLKVYVLYVCTQTLGIHTDNFCMVQIFVYHI